LFRSSARITFARVPSCGAGRSVIAVPVFGASIVPAGGPVTEKFAPAEAPRNSTETGHELKRATVFGPLLQPVATTPR
jgi:hypothetical protein